MADSQLIKPYKKDCQYTYTLGAFPTYELIKTRPHIVSKVVMSKSYTDRDNLVELCRANGIPTEVNDKLLNKISDKDNCYVAGIFDKYTDHLNKEKPHIVLVNPSNMGNLGTILRTAAGFGISDIAIILPGADIFNPKTVRASMGALFRVNHHLYSSFDEYAKQYVNHEFFTFMLNGERPLTIKDAPKAELYSLIFGNEATGLDNSFLDIGTSIIIPQTPEVDSLNLTIAVGIAAYVFTNQ